MLAGQFDAGLFALALVEIVRDLQQDARAVARQRVGAGGTAVRQPDQDFQCILDDAVGFFPLQVADEPDAAGIVLVPRIVQALRGRKAARGKSIFFLEKIVIGHKNPLLVPVP